MTHHSSLDEVLLPISSIPIVGASLGVVNTPSMDASRRDLLQILASTALVCPLLSSKQGQCQVGVPYQALHWEDAGNKRVKCVLCPRECVVADRERGTCGVRENRDGTYYSLVHSNPCSLHNDPIEKKPLFHYRPGTKALSLATAGCNIECRFCQNWEISQFRPEQVPSKEVPPEAVVRHAKRLNSGAIAFTYSEPVVFYEYMRDICLAAKDSGVGRVMISNGYIKKTPLLALLKHLDAIKIDFKAFSESFYRDICSAHLRPVLDTLVRIKASGVWLEMVMLVIPTLNDDMATLKAMSRWIVQKLGPDVPIHFTRFHSMYKIKNLPPTPIKTLEKARNIALDAGIHYAYAGNVPGHPSENTYCPSCRTNLIERDGYYIVNNRIKAGSCPKCSGSIEGVWV
ncbi:MAG: AmmeMemoRadiSam system radical SAM enzyme [Myxococcota bacterium]|nr:AmmeMemoRadiSam system radical SAM enzyme [Myxococcota bacterium]